ncbi:D-methionine transport system substrate-binding protein [Sanguibacter gelidistatuariae]|uniref:D-methionine transport system substrate-binding protein n=1 Tax=Sanguibacter gelidistatuariae TaxID=1814289 RepID=A0A1G6GNC5_9MICO|nr:MetQ/NlpA family ABC transporter substrate-binding protein [Sanguibacter gelidistatuariae]SDB83444.1 D-methionine transport system substrate-binding protein [Sanguibacter gelidistatuariae]
MIRSTRAAKAFGALALATVLSFTLTACGSGSDSKAASGEKDDPIKIGVVGAAANDQWSVFETQAEKAGIYVDIIDLGTYPLPNPALTEGELDLNQFQHLQYLAEYNVSSGQDLTPIGSTAIYPLSLYSNKYDSLDAIPQGAEIVVPNDPSNLARALLVLRDAGLVELKDGGSATSTELDVLDTSRVKVTPIDATQTVLNLDSVDGAVVNNDFVKDSGLKPADALAADSADSEGALPYINIWVSRAEDKDNKTFAKLVEISQSPEVEAALQEASLNTAVLVHKTPAELQTILTPIQTALKK